MPKRRHVSKHPSTVALEKVLELPGANPLKTIIHSHLSCAATILYQYRMLSSVKVYVSVASTFDDPPETVPGLSKKSFLARKKVLEWFSEHGKRWIPILYQYEVCTPRKQREQCKYLRIACRLSKLLRNERAIWDISCSWIYPSNAFSWLWFIPPFAAMCGECSESDDKHDYDAMTKYHAHRLMSLLQCLYHDLDIEIWVRATYTMPKQNFTLARNFTSPYEPPQPSEITVENEAESEPRPPTICVTSNDFVPCLLSSELENIDNLLAQGSAGPSIPPHVRAQVLGSKDARPDVGPAWRRRNPRQCSNCGVVKQKNLMLCSKCKLDYYCGKEWSVISFVLHFLRN
ncbi:hypothetical protein Hypma_004290 [Hypsizygus marmoreus]|uniref:MYND-type domain-containing protein n=1 Tax=Hypsizygus marmoreus TaxID=39966 RepID=A0A369K656_HYPMA|nr:hypothetical protein Hypma_004290 [Hypsizygus marmoreus]